MSDLTAINCKFVVCFLRDCELICVYFFREGKACNHIAGLLYALVDMTNKKSEGLDSVTSSECKWSKPRKRHLTPKESQQLSFKKHKFETEVEKNDKRCKQKLFEDKVSETKPLKVTQVN